MKGLIYASTVLNKGWYFGAGVASVLGTVLGVVLQVLVQNDTTSFSVENILIFLPVIPVCILAEYLARDLERSIKCHFTDYAMAAVSKNAVALTELAKNLLCAVISIIAVSVMLLCYMLAGADFSLGDFVGMWEIVLFVYTIEWMVIPVTVHLKNAEQAGLIVGIILGLIVLAIILMSNIIAEGKDFLGVYVKLLETPIWIALPIIAAVYALFYIILLKRLKRGDVC